MTHTPNTEAIHAALVKLGQRIRTLREAQHLSLTALASRCDIKVAELNKIEGGEADPTIDTIYAIAEGLDTPLPDLFADLSFSAPQVM